MAPSLPPASSPSSSPNVVPYLVIALLVVAGVVSYILFRKAQRSSTPSLLPPPRPSAKPYSRAKRFIPSPLLLPRPLQSPQPTHRPAEWLKAANLTAMNNNGNVNNNAVGGIILNYNPVENHVGVRDPIADNLEVIEKGLARFHVPRALYDAQPPSGCMKGTRVQLLDEASRFVTTLAGGHAVWIGGMAGTGKTSVALTLCQRLRDDPTVLLGGTFFCSRAASAIDRTDAQRIIPTLATLLGREVPAYAAALAAELRKDPDVADKSIRIQVERLLAKPLGDLKPLDRTIVFIIDALDECDNQQQLSELIMALTNFQSTAPVKFVVTSRPDPFIRNVATDSRGLYQFPQLHTIGLAEVTLDIRLYIQTMFEKSSAFSTPTWYTERDLTELAILADGLFVFAAVAIGYILTPTDGPRRSERLRKLKLYDSKSALTPLDRMYSLILTHASDPDVLEPTELVDTHKIVSAILSSRTPLSIKALAELLDLSPEQLRGALNELHAVIFVPEQDGEGELRTLHPTFVDFVLTRAPPHIRISKSDGQDALARGCLQRLEKDDLCFNVSHSRSSYDANPATEPDWIDDSLRYACTNWSYHVDQASERLAYDEQIYSILRHKFLFWLEVLSVIGEVGLASELLRVAAKTQLTVLQLFVRDAISFVESSREAIEFSAAHIYISALPFAPKTSLVVQTFSEHFKGLVTIDTFGNDSAADNRINAVAITPDGHVIASASSNGSVRKWNAETREEMLPAMPCHNSEVHSVAISGDGRFIATGSADHNVRLYASRGQPVTLSGHNGGVRAVAFSPDSRQLLSGSEDRTLRVWGTETGQQVQLASMAASSSVSSVAYSRDGDFVAAGGSSGAFQTFHAATGELDQFFEAPPHPNDIKSLAFAPDGRSILVSFARYIVGVGLERGSEVLAGTGHTDRVNAVAYSTDGRFIVSGADDATIRLWDAETGNPCGPVLRGHAGSVLSLVASPVSQSVVSVGSDGTIRAWDLEKARWLSDQRGQNSMTSLATACYQDGWLVSPEVAERRLLWVPPEHRGHLEIGDHSRVIAAHRVVVTTGEDDLCLGENWSMCWRASS